MNVFKNKKRWKNKKTLENVKKRALNKNVKNVFFTSILYITLHLRFLTWPESNNSKDHRARQTKQAIWIILNRSGQAEVRTAGRSKHYRRETFFSELEHALHRMCVSFVHIFVCLSFLLLLIPE